MSWNHYTERAAQVLRELGTRRASEPLRGPAPPIEQLAKVIRRKAERRRMRRVAFAAATAALWAAAIVVGLRIHGRPLPRASSPAFARPNFVAVGSPLARLTGPGGSQRAFVPGDVWHPGDRLQSAAENVELQAADGSSVSMGAGSDLQLIRADRERWLRLSTGTVTIHVAKLQVGERFVIVTPDAEVEVRGTRFQVQVHPAKDGCGRLTSVHVDEGVVAVRATGLETQVFPGNHWPDGCPQVSAPVASSTARLRKQATNHHLAVQGAGPAAAPTPASTLDTENDLFGAALRAERRGDRRQAVELLDLLLNRFPASPLRASALSARERVGRTALP